MSELQWLEMELARQLRPVEAPEELWDRIHAPRTRPRAGSIPLWPIAAALLLTVSGVIAWRITLAVGQVPDLPSTMEKLAVRQLSAPQPYDLYSADPLEIQAWLKTRANIDIELPASGAVRLLGARIIRLNGAPIAAVGYQVGDSPATLLVCRKRSGGSAAKHVFSRVESLLFTWSMHEQVYTIASAAKDQQAACLLCHANPAPGGILTVTSRV